MRCKRMNGEWPEEDCIKFQDAGKPSCKGCREGAELREDLGLPPLVLSPVTDSETKYCSRCRETKAREEFSPDKKTKDHLRSYCKPCTAAQTRAWQRKKKGLPPEEPIKKKRNKADLKKLLKKPATAQRITNKVKETDPANQRQVGGSHYRQYKIQPYEFFLVNQIPHHKASIIRRILRYDHPTGGGREDLEKIRHEIDLIIELEGWTQ